jgi:hypothetical protein
LIVHALDAGQARHGVFGHGFVRRIGDRAGQGDDAVLGISLDGIVLEVGFERVGLRGGRLDAAVRAAARSGELVINIVLTTAASVKGNMDFILRPPDILPDETGCWPSFRPATNRSFLVLERIPAGTIFTQCGSLADFAGELGNRVVRPGRCGPVPAGINIVAGPVGNQVV